MQKIKLYLYKKFLQPVLVNLLVENMFLMDEAQVHDDSYGYEIFLARIDVLKDIAREAGIVQEVTIAANAIYETKKEKK